MSCFSPILAQVEDSGAGFENELRNRLITFGAYASVMLIVLIWAICIRKQKSKRRRIHRHRPHNWELPEQDQPRRHHRHRRRQKTTELPKNPSRAEAGGLPPRREEPLPPED